MVAYFQRDMLDYSPEFYTHFQILNTDFSVLSIRKGIRWGLTTPYCTGNQHVTVNETSGFMKCREFLEYMSDC
jgi:hypothetical protein